MFDPNSYYFGAAVIAYGNAALSFYADQGAESVMWFLPDDPASRAFTDGILTPAAATLGLDYKTVYFDPVAPDWSVLATTALAADPDVSGSIAGTDGQCQGFVGALRDAGYDGNILAASCNGLFEALGEQAVGVDTDLDHWHPGDPSSAPSAKQAELAAYADAMTAAGHEDLVVGNALMSFGDVVNLAGIMADISGPIDGASVAAALMATKDFDSFAGPPITCDHTVVAGNSACHAGLLFFRIAEDGSTVAVTDDFVIGA
jgi:branched-chain amino acid transport system substrate-binding protein